MSDGQRVAVIGAGIVGMACASYLQREGHDVTVVDSRAPGEGCSFGNAGLLSPGAVVPQAMPGAWRQVPKWLLDPLGPLAIRPGYLPRLAPWLAAWLGSCREERAWKVSRALAALHAPVFENYQPLLEAAGATSLVRRVGQLYVSGNDDGATGSQLAQAMRRAAGIRTESLTGNAIRELEPMLGPAIRSALYFPENGHSVNSFRLVQALAECFQRSGGKLLRRTVTEFDIGPAGPRALFTDADPLPIKTLVVAAGPWSNALTTKLGSRFPLEAERGYHLHLPSPGVAPRIPVVNRDYSFTITPMENGLRFAGTAEFAGLATPPDYRRARMLLAHARRMFPGIDGIGATEWMGPRPSLPDTLPVIDRSPRYANVYFAFGHGHFGVSEAPTTGKLIAELVGGRASSLDLSPYRATRFS